MVIESEILLTTVSRLARRGIIMQVDVFIFDTAPESLGKNVVESNEYGPCIDSTPK